MTNDGMTYKLCQHKNHKGGLLAMGLAVYSGDFLVDSHHAPSSDQAFSLLLRTYERITQEINAYRKERELGNRDGATAAWQRILNELQQ